MPLVEELRLIDAGWDDALIVIDDCQVPGDAGYTYDVRSGVISGVASSDGGVTLAAENLPIATGALVGYPAEPSESETGARRGTLYIAQGERARAALRSTDSIRTGRRDG